MRLDADAFALFGLPRRFALDTAQLNQTWKSLLSQAHPDFFAAQGEAATALATQWSVKINESYQALKNPLSRAALLCELASTAANLEGKTHFDTAFLEVQMQWRERLSEAQSVDECEALEAAAQSEFKALLAQIENQLDVLQTPAQAAQSLARAQFIDKFLQQISDKLSVLEN